MGRAKTVTCLTALLLAGCSGERRLVVGAKNFTEQDIIGEVLAQHIERRLGIRVERKLHLGGTLLAHDALVNGAIDLYPEYTGTALTAILKLAPEHDAGAVLRSVTEAYRKRWRISWMAPLGFNNTFAMVVRGETARAAGLSTLSEAARQPAGWRLGVGYEFLQRPDGLDGLLRTYGLKLGAPPITMDLGLLYPALESKRVDMIAANATDGLLSVRDVTVLRDDKGYFPPYQCAVAVREQTLAAFPGLRAALEQLTGTIPDALMQKMNYRVDGEHRSAREVAAALLDEIEAPPAR